MRIKNQEFLNGKDLLVMCPTRERPQVLRTMINSYEKCTSSRAGLVICLDEDDPEIKRYHHLIRGYAHIIQPRQTITKILNQVSIELLPGFKYYSHINDDFVYRTRDWDRTLVETIEKNGGWGIAYGDDLMQGQALPTTSVVSANIIKNLGWFQLPGLTHLYGDNVFKVIGDGLNRFFYHPNVVIEHCHHIAKKAELDNVYKRTNSQSMYEKDGKVFQAWMKDGAGQAVSKLVKYIHFESGFSKKVSLCMIVGDYEDPQKLAKAINSVKDWVEEICIVFNYKVFQNPIKVNKLLAAVPLEFKKGHVVPGLSWEYLKWTNFSDIRNKSLNMAHGDYIIWLDCDDIMDAPWQIKDSIFRNPNADYFKCQIYAYNEHKGKELILQDRLLRNKKEYRFKNSVHEDVSYSLIENKAVMGDSKIIIHHTGYSKTEDVKKKNARNLKLALVDLKKPDAHILTYFAVVNCLMINQKRDDYIRALKLIDEAFEKFKPGDDDKITPKLWVLRGLCCRNCDQIIAAQQSFQRAYNIKQNPEGAVNLAWCLMQSQKWNEAIDVLMPVYNRKEFEIGNMPYDMVEIEALMLRDLGDCWGQIAQAASQTAMGQPGADHAPINRALQESEKFYRQYLGIKKTDLNIADRLCSIYRITNRHQAADMLTVQFLNIHPGYFTGWFNLGQTELLQKRYVTARVFFEQALRYNPRHTESRHNLRQIGLMLRGRVK